MPDVQDLRPETRLEALDLAPSGLHLYRLEEDARLVFIGANRTAERILGVSHDIFVGRTIEEAFPALTETEIPARYREVAATGESWQTSQVDYDEQGIRGAFEVLAVPLGNRCMGAFFTETTKHLRLQHELRVKQQELDAYFENALDLLCIVTLDGRFKRLNPEWERVLGYGVGELIGKDYIDYVHPDDLERTRLVDETSHRTSSRRFVNRYRAKDGTYRDLEWSSFPGENGIYAVARDITERLEGEQKLERALLELTRKTQEMESLLYVTTHDLRSPLVNIQGFAARIERSADELGRLCAESTEANLVSAQAVSTSVDRVRGSLDYIKTSAQKMDRLIAGLLQLSRLGRQPMQWSRVDMESLWRRVVESFQHQLRESKVTVESLPVPACFGDPNQLDQVLSNLLDNAIKYRDPHRPCHVSFSGEQTGCGTIVYRVSDSGRGIAPDHIERIWELFHRLSPHSDAAGEGIGLTAVRQIVRRHEGQVTVQSTPGVGSTFTIELKSPPLDTPRPAAGARESSHE